ALIGRALLAGGDCVGELDLRGRVFVGAVDDLTAPGAVLDAALLDEGLKALEVCIDLAAQEAECAANLFLKAFGFVAHVQLEMGLLVVIGLDWQVDIDLLVYSRRTHKVPPEVCIYLSWRPFRLTKANARPRKRACIAAKKAISASRKRERAVTAGGHLSRSL